MRRDQRDAEFGDYVDARSARFRRTAYVICGDWHTAEDVVQTLFAKLYVHWPRIRRDTVDAYARRALTNLCLRRKAIMRREPPLDRPPDQAAPAVDPEVRLDLVAAIAQLPARQRAIIALRFLDDLSVHETAAALDIADGTVKSQTSQALDNLRKHLSSIAP